MQMKQSINRNSRTINLQSSLFVRKRKAKPRIKKQTHNDLQLHFRHECTERVINKHSTQFGLMSIIHGMELSFDTTYAHIGRARECESPIHIQITKQKKKTEKQANQQQRDTQ